MTTTNDLKIITMLARMGLRKDPEISPELQAAADAAADTRTPDEKFYDNVEKVFGKIKE